MSWDCPHRNELVCRLRQAPCAPGAKGCTLPKDVWMLSDADEDKEADPKAQPKQGDESPA